MTTAKTPWLLSSLQSPGQVLGNLGPIHTGRPAFRIAAAIAYVGLLCTWCLVAIRTARDSLRGNLFLPQARSGPIKAIKDPPK